MEIILDFVNLILPTGDQFYCTIDKGAPLDAKGYNDIDGIGCV